MARLATFEVSATSAAPPSVVFGLLADGTTWPRWSPIGSFELEREGGEGGESVGAIRVFKTGRVVNREEIVEIRPPESFSYQVLSGLSIKNHRADVILTEMEGGTSIVWRERFEASPPGTGWLTSKMLRGFVARCAQGLARAAAEAHAASADGEMDGEAVEGTEATGEPPGDGGEDQAPESPAG